MSTTAGRMSGRHMISVGKREQEKPGGLIRLVEHTLISTRSTYVELCGPTPSMC